MAVVGRFMQWHNVLKQSPQLVVKTALQWHIVTYKVVYLMSKGGPLMQLVLLDTQKFRSLLTIKQQISNPSSGEVNSSFF